MSYDVILQNTNNDFDLVSDDPPITHSLWTNQMQSVSEILQSEAWAESSDQWSDKQIDWIVFMLHVKPLFCVCLGMCSCMCECGIICVCVWGNVCAHVCFVSMCASVCVCLAWHLVILCKWSNEPVPLFRSTTTLIHSDRYCLIIIIYYRVITDHAATLNTSPH